MTPYTTLCVHVPPLLKVRFLKRARELNTSCRRLLLELPVSGRIIPSKGLVRLCVRVRKEEYLNLKSQAEVSGISLSELIRRKLQSLQESS